MSLTTAATWQREARPLKNIILFSNESEALYKHLEIVASHSAYLQQNLFTKVPQKANSYSFRYIFCILYPCAMPFPVYSGRGSKSTVI